MEKQSDNRIVVIDGISYDIYFEKIDDTNYRLTFPEFSGLQTVAPITGDSVETALMIAEITIKNHKNGFY